MKYITMLALGVFAFAGSAYAVDSSYQAGNTAVVNTATYAGTTGSSTTSTTGTKYASDSDANEDALTDGLMIIRNKESDDPGETGAGPALLEIDTVRGESAKGQVEAEWKVEKGEKFATDPEKKDYAVQNNESNLEFIKVRAVEVRGWDPKKKEEIVGAVAKLATVSTEEELEVFTQALVVNDSNIENVVVAEDRVDIDYKQPAKLFGFIPIKLTVKSSIDTKGEVKVKFPWYSFLSSTNKKKVEAAKEEVKDKIDSLSEKDEMESFRLQDAMDRYSRMMSTLSNLLKKMSDTTSGITQNMK